MSIDFEREALTLDTSPQNSAGWYAARRGIPTGSNAAAMRARTDGLTKQQRRYVDALRAGNDTDTAKTIAGYTNKPKIENLDDHIKGTVAKEWTDTARTYAMDVAREIAGGEVPRFGDGGAARVGHEQEPFGAIAYTAQTGRELEEVGFICTSDRRFGCSVDRLVVDARAAIEVKTMVSSVTLFKVVVGGDISEYLDQCLFAIWLLTLEWVDLCLWCPDLNYLHVIRIARDEEQIQALEDDVLAFAELVEEYVAKLRATMTGAPLPVAIPAAALAPVSIKPTAAPAAIAAPAF